MFIALNIYQHHVSHLHSALTVKKSNFNYIAQKLVSLSPELIQRVSKHIENEGKISDLFPQEKNVMTLLKQVNTVSVKIPGSSASKLQVQNEIHAYMGYFGLPQLYMTLNPNASHSPIFQAMYGDDLVDLSS
jgi:Helitron helicase-like domain at N-terminus